MDRKQVKSEIKDFTEGNIMNQLLVFATPLFLSNLLQIVYNMVDMVNPKTIKIKFFL